MRRVGLVCIPACRAADYGALPSAGGAMPQDDLSDLASLDLASLPEVQTTAFKALHAQQPLPIDRYLLFDAAELSSLHEQQGVLLFFLDLAIISVSIGLEVS